MAQYILITGGVTTGIGKGCLSSVLGRLLAKSGLQVGYQKIEPCLQKDISAFPNTHFGEVIIESNSLHYDSDVARAKFFIPGFNPFPDSDVSLGNMLRKELSSPPSTTEPAPKLSQLSDFFSNLLPYTYSHYIIEVGGTAGEIEHGLVLQFLKKSLGKPILHIHLTASATVAGGTPTSKPAQISINSLSLDPDIVLMRSTTPQNIGSIETEFQSLFTLWWVEDNNLFPEAAYYQALQTDRVKWCIEKKCAVNLSVDEFFTKAAYTRKVAVVTDDAGKQGYQSLHNRLLVWSKQQIQPSYFDGSPPNLSGFDGLVLIGETYFNFDSSNLPEQFPVLDLRFKKFSDARKFSLRPDWHGTADSPVGKVYEFVNDVLNSTSRLPLLPNAYHNSDFASKYIKASEANRLRDHALLDKYISKTLRKLKNTTILDIGCGTGRWASRLSKKGAQVIGIEPAEPMYRQALQQQIPNFQIHLTSIEEYDTNLAFDYIIASMSLDHCSDLKGTLLKCSKWLKKGGKFIISTEHPIRTAPKLERWTPHDDYRRGLIYDYDVEGIRNYYWFGNPHPVKVYHHKIESWVQYLTAAGLRIVDIREPISDDPEDAGIPRFWLLTTIKD